MNSKNNNLNINDRIIKIQRNYKSIKTEINLLNYSVSFQRDY